MLIIRGGRIHDAIHSVPFIGDISIKQGKIIAIEKEIPCKDDDEVCDVSGKEVYPGFVEAHGHVGMYGYGIGAEGHDFNEGSDFLTPQMRAIDGIQPADYALVEAREAGVTTLCVGPGSANVLGGTFAAIKPVGKRVEDMCICNSVAMKCAFGENPKRCYHDKGNASRMGTAAHLREILFKAREYMEKIDRAGSNVEKLPPFDMKLHALLPVMRREIPLKAHAHQADDIFTALRIAREFNLKITIEHTTEGHLVAEELAKENVMYACGPTFGHATKYELRNQSWTTPGVLAKAGCHVCIITDSPWTPEKHLPLCAGLAIKAGMDPFDALQAITIKAAEHIGLADRVGSLETGKDADIVIADGSPFEVSTTILDVLINGKSVINTK